VHDALRVSRNDPRAGELSKVAANAVDIRVAARCGRGRDREFGRETKLPVNKVTWQQVGHVTEPGRYMFRFGWLTIAPDDLSIWTQFPDASFTLVQTSAPPLAIEAETDETPSTETDEFHLGAFELHIGSEPGWSDMQPSDERPIEA
jgi:hypothetical protein